MNRIFKFGIMGAGRTGRLYIENLQNNVEGACVKSIADTVLDEETMKFARMRGLGCISTDVQSILDDREIDAVVICSPANHTELIRRAAAARKHIFCEPPAGNDANELKNTLKAVKIAGVQLQIGFVRRFDKDSTALMEAVREGGIGKPEIIKITTRAPAAARNAGLLLDNMLHDFDMARCLALSEASEVSAVKGTVPLGQARDDTDTAFVTLEFENGAVCVIDHSRRAPCGFLQKAEVQGEFGCLQSGITAEDSTVKQTYMERYKQAFIDEMNTFVRAIADKNEVPVKGNDALEALRIALAAKKSMEQRRTVKLWEI